MIARRPTFIVLVVAACLASMGCQSRVPAPAGTPKGRPQTQVKARPKVMQAKVDDDSLRVRLLMAEAVQKDLGLTADQIGQLRDIAKISEGRWQELQAKVRETVPPSRAFSPAESEARQRELKELSEDWRSIWKELRTKALAMLTPCQGERLAQIQLQRAVGAALARPEIIKALELSEEQREKIRALGDRVDEKLLAKWPDLDNLDPKERRQKMLEFLKASDKDRVEDNKRVLDVLTPEQRAKFEKLHGKKIEVTWPDDMLIPEDAAF